MKINIHIPHLFDFYIFLSRKDPDVHKVTIEESVKVSKDSFDEEALKENLDRVNMWIGNCDQKASIVLAVIGVAMTVLLTSDFVKHIRHILVEPMKQVWPRICEAWDVWQWIMALAAFYTAVIGMISIYQLLYVLRAKTDLSKFHQGGIIEDSMYHYETVAKRNYKDFCKDKVEFLNDLRSQVYVNSCICTSKFAHYKTGIHLLEWAIPGCIVLGLIMLVY